MKQNRIRDTLLALLGAALIAAGGILRKNAGEMRFSSFAMAAGILLFGKATADLMKSYIVFSPELKKQEEIEKNDERNQLVRGKAAYKCLFVMQAILLLTGLALSFMDWTIGMIVLCLSILQSFLLAGFTSYYQKRM